jgi:DNA polymerase-3 subunit gamma/tau
MVWVGEEFYKLRKKGFAEGEENANVHGVSYRVFARKYRPQTFEEVVGQEHITRTLQNAIKQNRLAQAYLLVGPRGIGKTSTARILAKALNCEKGMSPNPCGRCSSCLEIAEGNNLDVLEIDGASNNSVDNIRDLRDNAAYAPSHGAFKIYLIDEVHMLSTGAFNALLKTLEEPPPHVKFIFATTEAQKVPATITSRCQRFDLRRIPDDLIARHLASIAEKESIELATDAAEVIARGADGGLRDAESMLDQMAAFCGNKIDATDVFEVFGFTSKEVIAQLGRSILSGSHEKALQTLREQAAQGKDLGRLLVELVSWFRDCLLQTAENTPANEPLPPASKLLEILDLFSEAEGRMRWASDKQIHFEISLIKAAHLLQQASLDEVLATLVEIGGGRTENHAPRKNVKPTPADQTEEPALPPPPAPEKKAEEAPIKPENREELSALEQSRESSPNSLGTGDIWTTTIRKLAEQSRFKFGWLEEGRLLSESEGKFIVELPESQQISCESILWEPSEKNLLSELARALGRPCQIEYRFVPDPEPPPAEAEAVPTKKPFDSPPSDEKQKPQPQKQGSNSPAMEELKNDPKIRMALDIFEAEIIQSKS